MNDGWPPSLPPCLHIYWHICWGQRLWRPIWVWAGLELRASCLLRWMIFNGQLHNSLCNQQHALALSVFVCSHCYKRKVCFRIYVYIFHNISQIIEIKSNKISTFQLILDEHVHSSHCIAFSHIFWHLSCMWIPCESAWGCGCGNIYIMSIWKWHQKIFNI